jgi:hypothetical protein
VIPAKTGVVAVVAFQCRETGHGMFDHPAVLAGDDQAGNRRLGRPHAPPSRATFSRRCRLRPDRRSPRGTVLGVN